MLENGTPNLSVVIDHALGPLTDQERLVLALFRWISAEQQRDILRFLEAFAELPRA